MHVPMKDRLQQFMKAHQMTSTKLADQIGVQRSSISHILSGRNNPSYDFIYKFLQHHPDINPKWLIMGEGSMYDREQQTSIPFRDQPEASTPRESNIENKPDDHYGIKYSEHDKTIHDKEPAQIERIVIFYTDHHFEEFRPGRHKS